MLELDRKELRAAALQWISKDPDENTRRELRKALDRLDDGSIDASSAENLQEAFGSRLCFGTAGLRGVLGFGPARMNRLVIRQTTEGLARHISQELSQSDTLGVIIAYDGRHGSQDFAHDAAGVLAKHSIKAYLFAKPAPTPLCGFAVRKFGAAAGIVVTASHNPPDYNGFKVYTADGTQINAPVDAQIAAHIDSVAAEDTAPELLELEQARSRGLLEYLDEAVIDDYEQHAISQVCGASNTSPASDIRTRMGIAYTPLHGVGAPIALSLLSRRGFRCAHIVNEQAEPDPDFPTVKFPNPEERGATDMLVALAEQEKCTIAIANDPDADRLAVCGRDDTGSIRQLSGDMLGAILGDWALQRALANGAAPQACWLLSTIVSSRFLARMALATGANHRETLTGFKWLGPAARQLHEAKQHFVMAYEEALGYMMCPMVWDKDGLTALLAVAELSCELESKGLGLWQQLRTLHLRYGLSLTTQRTIALGHGITADGIMSNLRSQESGQISGYEIICFEDLLAGKSGDEEEGLPKTDVLRYYLAVPASSSCADPRLEAPRVTIRPSGTEPKVKMYFEGSLYRPRSDGEYSRMTKLAEQELDDIAIAFDHHIAKASQTSVEP